MCTAGFAGFDAEAGRAVDMPVSFAVRSLGPVPVLMICIGESADPCGELLHCLVDRGRPDGLIQVEVVVRTGQLGVADRAARHRAEPLREGPYVRRRYQVFLAVHDEHGRQVSTRREAAVVAVAADQARDTGLAVAHRPDRQIRPGRAAGDEQRAGLGTELRGVRPYPGDRVAHVGYLVRQRYARLQPVVRADADETAPAGQVPDERPRFAGLAAGMEAAAVDVQQDRRAGWPVTAVIYVQCAVRPGAVGQAARPDHVEPAGEERGAQDPAPRPSRLTRVAQCRIRAQRTVHDDHEAGHGEQRDNGADGPGRGIEVAVRDREYGRGDQQIPDDEGQLADHQRGDGGEGAEPAPPGERARHPPGHQRDRPQVPDRHQELPAMQGRTRAGPPSAVGSARSPCIRPAFRGDLRVPITW